MKKQYTYTILRYRHDIVSEEFVNVGIVMFSRIDMRLRMRFVKSLSRISRTFLDINTQFIRALLKQVEYDLTAEYGEGSFFENNVGNVKAITQHVLPDNDDALFFSKEGAGVTNDLDIELEELFYRFVGKYLHVNERQKKSDEDVWNKFKKPMKKYGLDKVLKPHIIQTPLIEMKFKHTWKNDIWHINEPVSFDLADEENMYNKATMWIGRVMALRDSKEKFKVYLLTGKPENKDLVSAYSKVEQLIVKEIPKQQREIIREDEAEDFAKELKNLIDIH